ncbi:MaoC/PaaZ C-terminal domain-containing protein [Duganella sp. P38]|uniref:MaoC/PaaZ C-terminal domain-containing protein n=1 Tax=Duganella sp. P38 TaxID=3423949 RepID=UPI003D7BCC28
MNGVPYRLLRHQLPMLLIGARVVWHTLRNSVSPPSRAANSGATDRDALVADDCGGTGAVKRDAPAANDRVQAAAWRGARVTRVIAAPPAELVDAYRAWAGAPPAADELPPHMVSQWSLPLVGELLLRMPYRLTSVINQGVSLRAHGPLPRNVPLHVSAAVEQIEETPGRTKVVVAVVTGTAAQPALVEARLHMSFLLPGPRAAKTVQARPQEPHWNTIGTWQADARDGLRFALLTGDFNPIHWCGPLARRSLFRGLVLHGFGSFVRSHELLKQQGIAFSEIDVRFVKPVPLPCSTLAVQIAAADHEGRRPIRLAGAGDAVHLAGNLR